MGYSIDDIKNALEIGKTMYEDPEAYEGRCETAKDGWFEYRKMFELLSFAYRELGGGES